MTESRKKTDRFPGYDNKHATFMYGNMVHIIESCKVPVSVGW